MFCFHYFIFFCFFNCQIMQLNAFDEEHNDIFAELWQKSEKFCKKSGKSEETLQTLNDNFQKIGKIKKEIVVKDEPHDDFKFDQFSNERQQKITKTVKEENVEKRVKSEFIEFDRISDKEEFDRKDGKEQSTDSIFDHSNLKESSSKSQKGIIKIYSEVEKQEIIAEFDQLKKEFKTRANGMSYDMNKIDTKIARTFGVSRTTISNWKKQLGVSKKRKNYTDTEKVELLKNFNKIKKQSPQLPNDKIAQMLNIHNTTLNRWERESRGLLEPGIKKIYSEGEKQEIIAKFDELKKEFKIRAKGMSYDMKKLEEKIAQKLGISRTTIYCWKKQLGTPSIKKIYSEGEKQEIIAKFDELKNEFKTRAKGMSYDMKNLDRKIAQKLELSRSTIYNWKSKIGVKFPIKINSSERSTSSTNSLNVIPWKWNDFGKKRNDRI